eukprot:3392160-Heterocapsa_arctica.AAC.1
MAAIEDARSSRESPAGGVPGFVPAEGSEEAPKDMSAWYAPRPPRGYRGVHSSSGSAFDEAALGSPEHQKLI